MDFGFDQETVTTKPSVEDSQSIKHRRQKAVKEVFAFYLKTIGRSPNVYTLTTKRMAMGMARLDEALKMAGGDLADAVELMEGTIEELAASDFHMGRDPKTDQKKYCDWEHVFRSAEQFQKWIQKALETGPKSPAKAAQIENDWSVVNA